LVDDDELILRLASLILTKNQIEHRYFNSAENLLNEPWDPGVTTVFSDMRLPGMSGLELCTALRKKNPAGIRIVALTAQVLPEEKEKIVKNGFDDLLLKPFSEADLLSALSEAGVTEPAAPMLDLTTLEKMVGDKQQLNSILIQCHEETSNDLLILSEAVESNDMEKLVLIIHRLAGRVGQIGANGLSAQLRKQESALKRNVLITDIRKDIDTIKNQLNLFLTNLTDEINSEQVVV